MIKIILEFTHSRRDMYGNVYWAVAITDTASGKTIIATCDHDSNVRSAFRSVYEWEEMHCSTREMPIRDFNRYTKGLPYTGCTEKDIIPFFRKALALECRLFRARGP